MHRDISQISAGDRIIDTDEPQPFCARRSEAESPFFITCDHSGNRIPKSLGTIGLGDTDLHRHIAWDIGAAAVAHGLSDSLDATLVEQNYSRLVIDCNRRIGVEASIPKRSEQTKIPGNINIEPEQAAARANEIYHPYHNKISDLLNARAKVGQPTLIVSVHSFTPVYNGVTRPWHIGFAYHLDSRFTAIMIDLLARDKGLCIGDNKPYAVSDETDYSVPEHGEKRGLAYVQIEIRQDLVSDRSGQLEWVERLSKILTEGYATLVKQG